MTILTSGWRRSLILGRQAQKTLTVVASSSFLQTQSSFNGLMQSQTRMTSALGAPIGLVSDKLSPLCALTQLNRNKQTKQQIRFVQTCTPRRGSGSFKAADVRVQLRPENERAPKPSWSELKFGHHCSDHMIKVHWTADKGWGAPQIMPVEPFKLHPYSRVFHYAEELFEGMKAYRGLDKKIRLFRPDRNMDRMRKSAVRLCFPDFDGDELITLMKQLLKIDADWIPPYETQASMYLRPTLIGIEPTLGLQSSNEVILFVVMGPVGPYFYTGGQLKPVSLMADPKYVRAWPGGSGNCKLGSNYAPTLMVQKEAAKLGHQQVLWLFGADHQLTEVGTMNIFMLSKRLDGSLELATPPLDDGIILPGITRQSLLELARTYKDINVVERVITMGEVESLVADGRMVEMFGAGTACVVCPIGQIDFQGKFIQIPEPKLALKMNEELTNIQYGVKPHPWSVLVS